MTAATGAGFARTPGAGDQTGVLSQPIDMHTLLDENFWDGMLFEEAFDMQATMFQPVGGMDRIPYAFAKALGDIVQYSSPVTEIRKTANGVRVSYTAGARRAHRSRLLHLRDAAHHSEEDSQRLQRAVPESRSTSAPMPSAYKIAWESRRFWEQDYNIYGGLEFFNTGCSPIWFPSAGMFCPRRAGERIRLRLDSPNSSGSAPTGKFADSRKSIERLHPGHGKELEKPMYVSWRTCPLQRGLVDRHLRPGQSAFPGPRTNVAGRRV